MCSHLLLHLLQRFHEGVLLDIHLVFELLLHSEIVLVDLCHT